MNTFLRTPEFDAWLAKLRDPIAKARIIARIRSAEAGNFGDCEPVGDGISEMRIHVGAGYRAYFCRRGSVIYLLLCGGDKSTQKRDIREAKRILKELEGQDESDQTI
ncbi:MAG: type II toxin-antitoxin system RelE/ParE family toxin [Pyrinomonadaceae bacterium]